MTWDTTTPAGTEAVSQGDDRIREFKVDVQAGLRANDATLGNAGAFPGSDTANPKFHYRGLKGTTAQRPAAGNYGLYFNTDTGTLQRDNGSTWEDINVSAAVTTVDNAIARFDGTTGKLQNSLGVISDTGVLTGIVEIDGVTATDNTTGNTMWDAHTRSTGTSVGVRGVALSSVSGAISISSTTPTTIGVTATIVTSGRPVWVGLTAGTSTAYIGGSPSGTGTKNYIFGIYRDGTLISKHEIVIDAISTAMAIPPSSVWCIDTPSAASHAYTCRISPLVGSSGNATCDNVIIAAFEL